MLWIRRNWMLLATVLLGAILRYTNLNWDAGGRLHPDEALIVNGAMSIRFFSHMFPGFHDYNGLSVYVLKLFTLGITSPETVTVIGRFLSATFSTLSIGLLYALGKRWWGEKIGVAAATLFAFTPLAVQLAHFYTTESILIFLLLTLLLVSPSPLRMAIPMGLLLATKNTAYLFLPLPLLFIHKKHVLLFAASTSLVFFFASPYSFIDFSGYLDRSRYLADVVSGRLLMDWTMQFQETNGLYWIQTIFRALGPLAVIGMIGVLRSYKQPTALFSLGFLFFLSFTYLKFTRYLAPLIPFFALFGAKTLVETKPAVQYLTIAIQILYGLMFASIYFAPHTSLQAKQWIQTNISRNSVILIEEWNSIIRFPKYNRISFNFYTLPDDEAKKNRLDDALAKADYVILESPKVKNTIQHLADRYPYTTEFYRRLEAGTHGFIRAAQFTSYPRLGPFKLPDDTAEETFTVFDHPTITIYRKSNK